MSFKQFLKSLLAMTLLAAVLAAEDVDPAAECDKAYDACLEKCDQADESSEQCYEACEKTYEACLDKAQQPSE